MLWTCRKCQNHQQLHMLLAPGYWSPGLAMWRGAGYFQSSPERRAEHQNTVFWAPRRGPFPGYFNLNFYVRNTTWNADTGEHTAWKRTWHMIKNLPCRNTALSPINTLFSSRWQMRLLTAEYSTLNRHNTSAQTHLRQQYGADSTSAELLEITSLTLKGAPLLLRDRGDIRAL